MNRIKSLESDDSYSRAELDRCLAKERDLTEAHQRLQYRIECLETELDNANRVGIPSIINTCIRTILLQMTKGSQTSVLSGFVKGYILSHR